MCPSSPPFCNLEEEGRSERESEFTTDTDNPFITHARIHELKLTNEEKDLEKRLIIQDGAAEMAAPRGRGT